MDVVEEGTHRLIQYIDAVTRRGTVLPAAFAEEYALRPDRRMKYIPGPLGMSMTKMLQGLQGSNEPLETKIEHLVRLGWVERHQSGVRLTALGRALLQDLNSPRFEHSDDDEAITITLDPEDPFVYARAIAALSDLGPSMLIDPYFRFEQLESVVGGTQVTRILTSTKIGRERVKQLGIALSAIEGDSSPEVRLGTDFHDRFIVSNSGRVAALGVSLNGIGKNISVVVQLGQPAVDVIRPSLEKLWAEGTPVVPQGSVGVDAEID